MKFQDAKETIEADNACLGGVRIREANLSGLTIEDANLAGMPIDGLSADGGYRARQQG